MKKSKTVAIFFIFLWQQNYYYYSFLMKIFETQMCVKHKESDVRVSVIEILAANRLNKKLWILNVLAVIRSFILVFLTEDYVRIALARLRLGSHNLMIERGRWEKPKRLFCDRLCEACNEIEDEYHVIFKCSW